jgi:hypothetical protein
MIKVLMAVLMVLVMASVALAAYPVNHSCLATQQLDPLTGVVTSVAPEQKVASRADVVTSANPAQCPASYFGAQDANRRIDPETGDAGNGAGSGDS